MLAQQWRARQFRDKLLNLYKYYTKPPDFTLIRTVHKIPLGPAILRRSPPWGSSPAARHTSTRWRLASVAPPLLLSASLMLWLLILRKDALFPQSGP